MEKKAIAICAWCGKVKIDGKWMKIFFPEGTLFTHGICPDCLKDLKGNHKKECNNILGEGIYF